MDNNRPKIIKRTALLLFALVIPNPIHIQIITIKVINCVERERTITRTKPANSVNIKEIEKHIV